MGFFDKLGLTKRGSVPSGCVPVSSSDFMQLINLANSSLSSAGISVNTESALGVPAIWAAVNFMSGTIAGLPLHVYKKNGDSRSKLTGGIAAILHDAVNDEMSSFEWRKSVFDSVFTSGRSYTFIERNSSNKIMNLWPLDPAGVKVKKTGWKKTYTYKDGGSNTYTYEASEIIDIPFMLKADLVSHRSPILTNKDTIALSIAATQFGSKFFQNGGVPPFAVSGKFQSAGAMTRAANDLEAAVRKAAEENRAALVLPDGLEVTPLGSDAGKAQLLELKRFSIEDAARIYSLPPTFLQDLTNGTFSNTEQQDLHFVKHTIKRWVEQAEQELNLKIFGRRNNRQYIEFSMDGLLRGDFKTRMEGYSTAVQNSIMKPNEVRAKENMASDPSGDHLLVQGATVPVEAQIKLINNNADGDNDGS
ncbi:phage portal protein [Lentilitoribacter sp. EG35]|uniref:phage portal protein n=1 Tax=Lentilitoribacter sp. EG35 TaxID=3234192 RepID=UPI00346146F0